MPEFQPPDLCISKIIRSLSRLSKKKHIAKTRSKGARIVTSSCVSDQSAGRRIGHRWGAKSSRSQLHRGATTIHTHFGREKPYDQVLARKVTRSRDPASEVKDGHGADVFFFFSFCYCFLLITSSFFYPPPTAVDFILFSTGVTRLPGCP